MGLVARAASPCVNMLSLTHLAGVNPVWCSAADDETVVGDPEDEASMLSHEALSWWGLEQSHTEGEAEGDEDEEELEDDMEVVDDGRFIGMEDAAGTSVHLREQHQEPVPFHLRFLAERAGGGGGSHILMKRRPRSSKVHPASGTRSPRKLF